MKRITTQNRDKLDKEERKERLEAKRETNFTDQV